MKNRECLKGWMVAPSPTDGEYVPFFIYVRDKDIVWDPETLTNNFSDYLKRKADNVELHYPMNEWKFQINDWTVVVHQDGTYHGYKKVNIQDVSDYINHNTIKSDINLPLPTINDAYFNINTQLNVKTPELSMSIQNVIMLEDKTFNKIEIESRTVGGVLFSEDFKASGLYKNEFMFITVDGNIDFELN